MPQSAHNKINFWREEHIALQEPDSHLKKVKKLSAGGGGGGGHWFNQGHNKDPKTLFLKCLLIITLNNYIYNTTNYYRAKKKL